MIVLEDDLITSPYFLTYMNDALNLYEQDERVVSIHGYVYPIKQKLPDYFFLRGADCWGWATWKRGWDLFNPDGQFLLNEIKKQKLEKHFNFNNTFNYTGMLQAQIDGKVSSWAIRWYASAFLENKYTLYPGMSFIENIGNDGSGTHRGSTEIFKTKFSDCYKPVPLVNVNDSVIARQSFIHYFYTVSGKNILYRIGKHMKLKFKEFL
ncbi:hypothetical protein FACS1894137_06970 [Spirochaetia bacterium]|nr:hypothetical protein FACS1894137_06970 [Spirochaetia bacterium]